MSSVLERNHCLVLNKGWNPLGTVTLERAITLLSSEYANGEPKAKIVDYPSYQQFTWNDWSELRPADDEQVIRSCRGAHRIPEIVLLTRFDRVHQANQQFSRRTLFKRDNFTCQYCGAQPGTPELNIDHIIPRSKGGLSTWDNCVLSCVPCNSRKADKTLQQSGMKLLSVPKKPKSTVFKTDLKKPIDSWRAFISDIYWRISIGEGDDALSL